MHYTHALYTLDTAQAPPALTAHPTQTPPCSSGHRRRGRCCLRAGHGCLRAGRGRCAAPQAGMAAGGTGRWDGASPANPRPGPVLLSLCRAKRALAGTSERLLAWQRWAHPAWQIKSSKISRAVPGAARVRGKSVATPK